MWKAITERIKALLWTPVVRRFGPGHRAHRNAAREYRQLQRMLVEDTGTLAYVGMRVNYANQRLTELEKMLHSGDLSPKDFACLQTLPQPVPLNRSAT